MAKPVADVIEDLEWLDSTGVGAFEAAERTGFASAHAMEQWLLRHEHYPLWLRLKARDPEGSHYERKKRPMHAVEANTRDHIATLLLQGEKSPAARTRAKAKKIRALLDDLTAALEADKDREDARREVEKLERQLREAKARLKGGVTTTPALNSDAAVIRAWARDNGVECPDRGRVPQSVVDAYNADREPEAATA